LGRHWGDVAGESWVGLEQVADVTGHDGVRMTALVDRHSMSPSVAAAAGPMQEALGKRR
jgi:hypothetical protein